MLGCAQIQLDQRVRRLSVDFAPTRKGDSASDADVGWRNIDEIGFKFKKKKKDECKHDREGNPKVTSTLGKSNGYNRGSSLPVCLDSDDV